MPARVSAVEADSIRSEIAGRVDAAGGAAWRSPRGTFATRGRRVPEVESPLRPPFMRDKQRLQYTAQFARYFQKTQVMTLPDDDVISRRSHHVQSIASIVETLCHNLGLNAQLATAIAYGHDFGHAPFAHLGEKVIDAFIAERELEAIVARPWQHEVQSKWIVERVAKREGREPLNLTIETTDGILCHCGEQFGRQRAVQPVPPRTWAELDAITRKGQFPMTLEGATVLVADTVSYLGKDLVDGVRLGLARLDDMPANARAVLGDTNQDIINVLVEDLILHSFEQDAIHFSDEVHAAAVELYRFNYRQIYLPRDATDAAARLRATLRRVLAAFWALTLAFRNDADTPTTGRRLLDNPPPCLSRYCEHLREIDDPELPHHDAWYAALHPFRLALDYVQGMTDAYCFRCDDELQHWAGKSGPGLFDAL